MKTRLLGVLAVFGLLLFGAQAQAQESYSYPLYFSEGGSGTFSFTYPSACTICFFDQMTNLTFSFTIGNQTWDEGDIGYKYGASTLWLNQTDPTDLWIDDGENGSGDTGILYFDNGSARLNIDEGDLDDRTYSVVPSTGNTVNGVYSINLRLAPPPSIIPVMPPVLMALMALIMAGIGAVSLRRLR